MFPCVVPFAIALAVIPLAASDVLKRPKIPKVWDQSELDRLDVPVPVPGYSHIAVSPEYYYRIPIAPIYKSYPVYAPGRAPRWLHGKVEAPASTARF